jgi:hypothetical protein
MDHISMLIKIKSLHLITVNSYLSFLPSVVRLPAGIDCAQANVIIKSIV